MRPGRTSPRRRWMIGVAMLAALSLLALQGAALAASNAAGRGDRERSARFATFNASLNRAVEGELVADLSTPDDVQAQAVAEVIQRVRPDVLLINEFDFDAEGLAARLFQQNYLSVGHNGTSPIAYRYRFVAPSNTGIPSGFDLDNNGAVGGPNDAFGFGAYPGQFGMAVYSRYPILRHHVRTFQHFLWKDMPGALLPDDPATPAPADWYSPEELAVFRLSSKSHWDVPVLVGGKVIHTLVSHPTPPVFDGPEDRNGTRNHDEIRLWADYVLPSRSGYVYDDAGTRGGLEPGARFVIMGDQNADPFDGDSVDRAIQQLLTHPRIQDPHPTSAGAVEATQRDKGANLTHTGPAAEDTADFADTTPGNLRADYVLPSERLAILGSGVFWLTSSDPLFARLTGTFPFPTSDHRMVWLDVRLR
jgi:hypothetical protein